MVLLTQTIVILDGGRILVVIQALSWIVLCVSQADSGCFVPQHDNGVVFPEQCNNKTIQQYNNLFRRFLPLLAQFHNIAFLK